MHAQTACRKLKPCLLLSNRCHTDYFDVSLTDQFASVHPYCQQSQPGTSDRLQPRWQVLTSELQPERLSRATLVKLCKTKLSNCEFSDKFSPTKISCYMYMYVVIMIIPPRCVVPLKL